MRSPRSVCSNPDDKKCKSTRGAGHRSGLCEWCRMVKCSVCNETFKWTIALTNLCGTCRKLTNRAIKEVHAISLY